MAWQDLGCGRQSSAQYDWHAAEPALRGQDPSRLTLPGSGGGEHGGAAGSGAPVGNRNALKHGLYTREAIAQRRAVRELLRDAGETLERLEKD
jgi:hypothetical protein